MPVYQYEAMNSVGQAVKAQVEANTDEEAVTRIRALGLFPTKVKRRADKKGGPAGSATAAKAAPVSRRRKVGAVSRKLLTQFTRQLSTLQDAGMPILRSLRILEQQQKPGPLRMAIRMIADDVEGGSTLSESMAQHPKAFDKLYTNMVAAGEAGGVLDVVLRSLADFMEASERLRKRVIGAMIYPIAVITFALLIVTGIMVFIIPKFKTIFESFGTDLPVVTKALMGISNWMADDFGWVWVVCIPVAIIFGSKLLGRSQGGRMFIDQTKLHIPVIGQIISKTAVSRFTRTLGVLLSAGVPLLDAIAITSETTGNEVLTKALKRVHDGIREGEDFAAPLKQIKMIEPMVVNMIDVGEETGDLDKMLKKIADTYDEEVQTLVAAMVSMLEPVMVITLGGIVGFIVLAIFMPLPTLLQGMQGGK
jgi:type IV pilus assembly protein PilC